MGHPVTWSATHTLPGRVRVAWHTTDGCIDRVSVIATGWGLR